MSSLVLSQEEEHVVRLDIRVEDSEWQGKYDRLEVYRSVLGDAGPYEELTAPRWLRARLPAGSTEDAGESSGPLAPVGGKDLTLLIGGAHEVEVTFSGTITHATAALEIEAVGKPLVYAYVDKNSRLAMQTQAIGGVASIEVLGGEAAPLLGLAAGDIGYGADPRPALIAGKKSYRVTDYYAQSTYYYKTAFSNSLTGARSEMSAAFSAKSYVGIDPDNIVRGYVRLVKRDGKPHTKQQVAIYSPVLGQQVDGATVTGDQEIFLTDKNGYVEVNLIRGTTIDVGIGGTNLMRKVTVPSDSSIELFDLLSPEYGSDDAFTVKKLDVPYAERRNL